MLRTALSVCGLILLGAISRLVPHLPNMTALNAVALKSGTRFGVWGIAIPLSSMIISDILIGFYNWRLLVSVYASFALVALLGRYTKKNSCALISAAAISSSFIFFFITNTVVWATSTWYPHTVTGLVDCYIVALPFLAPMIAGDIIFSFFLNSAPSTHPSFPLYTQSIFRRVFSTLQSPNVPHVSETSPVSTHRLA